jgi:hypothetical protein
LDTESPCFLPRLAWTMIFLFNATCHHWDDRHVRLRQVRVRESSCCISYWPCPGSGPQGQLGPTTTLLAHWLLDGITWFFPSHQSA